MTLDLRGLLRRHPLAVSVGLLFMIGAVAAALVLPRLDGIEVRSARQVAANQIEIEVAYRLASAPVGAIVAQVLTAEGPGPSERLGIEQGAAVARLRIAVAPDEADRVVVVELRPARAVTGLADQLLGARRRSVEAVSR